MTETTTTRLAFERAMSKAGWEPVAFDENGNPKDWQHERVRRQDDRSAFDFWKLTGGLTPAPF